VLISTPRNSKRKNVSEMHLREIATLYESRSWKWRRCCPVELSRKSLLRLRAYHVSRGHDALAICLSDRMRNGKFEIKLATIRKGMSIIYWPNQCLNRVPRLPLHSPGKVAKPNLELPLVWLEAAVGFKGRAPLNRTIDPTRRPYRKRVFLERSGCGAF
jgi:hypothetical protein